MARYLGSLTRTRLHLSQELHYQLLQVIYIYFFFKNRTIQLGIHLTLPVTLHSCLLWDFQSHSAVYNNTSGPMFQIHFLQILMLQAKQQQQNFHCNDNIPFGTEPYWSISLKSLLQSTQDRAHTHLYTGQTVYSPVHRTDNWLSYTGQTVDSCVRRADRRLTCTQGRL